VRGAGLQLRKRLAGKREPAGLLELGRDLRVSQRATRRPCFDALDDPSRLFEVASKRGLRLGGPRALELQRPRGKRVNATTGDDSINVSGNAASGVRVSGLAATVGIFHSDATDRLDVNTLAGNDNVNPTGLAAGAIQLFVDGLAAP
jgi:hypothetical protein